MRRVRRISQKSSPRRHGDTEEDRAIRFYLEFDASPPWNAGDSRMVIGCWRELPRTGRSTPAAPAFLEQELHAQR